MKLVRLFVLLSTCTNVVYCFLMYGRYLTLSRRSALFEKLPVSRREKPTNNIFTTYVQNRTPEQPSVPIESDPMLPMVEKIAQVADMRKASTVVVLRVSHLTEITQFIVLVEASNSRQIQAIADTVEEEVLGQCGVAPYVKEGTAASGWRVIDYGGVLVHVMSPAMRSFYKLEKRWINAERLDLSHVLQQPPPSAQHLQDQRTPDSGVLSAYGGWAMDGDGDADAGAGGAAVRGPYEGTEDDFWGFDALNAEDVAFWGEDELVQQLQGRRRSEDADATNTASGDSELPVDSAKVPAKRRLGSKRAAAVATSAADEDVDDLNLDATAAVVFAAEAPAKRSRKRTTSASTAASVDGAGASIKVVSSLRSKGRSKSIAMGRVGVDDARESLDSGAGPGDAVDSVDVDAADIATSSVAADSSSSGRSIISSPSSILDEFY